MIHINTNDNETYYHHFKSNLKELKAGWTLHTLDTMLLTLIVSIGCMENGGNGNVS
ncbi:hypothetical protein SERLA73DRAFT_168642 [Serpula lacrymans var. lacrymans S7.3]|uniref:Uncharacterized protein n=2 Tax=Serpula lacrymans var. lacrymans TaxID=341189 RepID=F8PYZ8_SERL3|nr:uncharacterized protein SERLADRAFT_449444 [Serpula lacrymans var. lacrymans S7.9]EGN99111.1 hypothetical protein SERLA73DRAFT_168642 [Serpula lacrymans var. lacrymans S7.3]EGO24681.1 hypothetical protein SERLADRAFT_449444 [Serpula lacrymans var. lacrymans S7.9]